MELALVSAPFDKVVESNFDFRIPRLPRTNTVEVYKSRKVKFSKVNANWCMVVTVHNAEQFKRSVKLTFMVECNLPNRADYDKYIINAEVVYSDHLLGSVECKYKSDPLHIPHYFLKEEMNFHSTFKNIKYMNSISFHVKMTLSCYPNPDEYVNTDVVLKQIISNNISMLSDSTYSDFTFVVEGKEFKVHKNILAAASPVFVKLFNSGMQESIKNKCIVNDITSNTFNHMLHFIYGGILPDVIADIAFSLYEAAHYYDLKNLMNICEKSIRSNLSTSNASSVYLLAELYNVEDLKSDALKQLNIGGNKLSPEMITNMLKHKESELMTLNSFVHKLTDK